MPGDETFGGAEAEAYLESLVKELRKVYRGAARELNAVLSSATSTGFAKFRAAEQLKQVNAIVTALNAEARNFSRRVTPKAYKRGTDITQARLSKAGIASELNMGNRIHGPAVTALGDDLSLDLLHANESMKIDAQRLIRKTQQAVLEDSQISRMVAQGAVTGEARRDTARRIREALSKELADGAKVTINGREYDPAKYAELVARTRSREAVTAGALNFGREYGIDLYQVSYHQSSCPECVPFQGKVFSATGATKGFPLLKKKPPFHPRCKHVLMAYIGADEAETEALRRLSNSKVNITSFADYDRALKNPPNDVSPVSKGKGFFQMDKTGVPKNDFPELKKALGNRLRVEGYDLNDADGEIIRRHVADLDALPKNLLQKVTREGLSRIVIGPGSVAQLPGYSHLAKVPVSGYPVGTTWLDVAGGYDRNGRVILLGTSPVAESHMVPHEFSHALADVMGYADDFRAKKAYQELLPTLDEFYAPDGQYSKRGFDEFLADSGTYAILNQQDRLSGLPDYFLEFLLNVMLKGRSPLVK